MSKLVGIFIVEIDEKDMPKASGDLKKDGMEWDESDIADALDAIPYVESAGSILGTKEQMDPYLVAMAMEKRTK